MLIYGGRSVSSEHQNKFNIALIGNGRGFLFGDYDGTCKYSVRKR